jgi:hypothetical protein
MWPVGPYQDRAARREAGAGGIAVGVVRCEVGLEDPLRPVLRQATLKPAAAIDAVVMRGAELSHVRAELAGTADALGGVQERLHQADGIQHLKGAGLDRRGARLAVRPHLALDEPRFHAVGGELGGGEQPGRASSDDKDVVLRHSISLEKRPRYVIPGTAALTGTVRQGRAGRRR